MTLTDQLRKASSVLKLFIYSRALIKMLKDNSHNKSIRIEVQTFARFKYNFSVRRAIIALLMLACISVLAILLFVFLQGQSNNESPADLITLHSAPTIVTSPFTYATQEFLQHVTPDEQRNITSVIENRPSSETAAKYSTSMTDKKTTKFLSSDIPINTESPTKYVTNSSITSITGNTFNRPSFEFDTFDTATYSPTTVKQLHSEVTKAGSGSDESLIVQENISTSAIEAFFGKYTYLLFGDRATFQDANEKCQEFNASLIYIESNEEEEMFNDLVLSKMSLLSNDSSQIMMWTAGYINSTSLTTVRWNNSSIRSSYERLCHGEISALSTKLRGIDRNSRTQEVHRIVKDFTVPHKTVYKWRETQCWRLFEDKVLSNTTMHFACKAKINTTSVYNQISDNSTVRLLSPLRQLNFFLLASYKEAEGLCNKSESTLVSIESEEDDEAIDRRIQARKDEFLSDPSIPTEELWNTLSPWMVWTCGFYDLASESMFPWEWAAKHRKFCEGALDRARAFWRSSRDASSLVHIVKNYTDGGSCWELLDPSYAVQRNYSLPVMCQSKMPSRLFKFPNNYSQAEVGRALFLSECVSLNGPNVNAGSP